MQTKNVVDIASYRKAPKAHRSTMETVILKREEADAWTAPPFQRPLRINRKVKDIAESLANKDIISLEGIITLGQLPNNHSIYIVDGQHRIAGFKLSECKEVIADIRLIHFDTMGEMAKTFVTLNNHLVKMRPDDILRGLEDSNPVLRLIRQQCPFVGYDYIRRNTTTSPVLSMSLVLRCWAGSAGEAPAIGSRSAFAILEAMTLNDAQPLTTFLNLAMRAWSRDPEYYRLWASLNLTMNIWMWRRMVVTKPKGQKRYDGLTNEQFQNCMMAESASSNYIEWLSGRILHDRERNPTYARLKAIFNRRLGMEGKKIKFPSPSWATNTGARRAFTL